MVAQQFLMKHVLFIIILASFLITGSAVNVLAQKKAHHTGSARAAYGNTVPFKSHVKKNRKAKKKARKPAKRKKLRNNREGYRRIPM
jgi:hypothetical protein